MVGKPREGSRAIQKPATSLSSRCPPMRPNRSNSIGWSAKFLAEMLGLPAPKHWGPFQMVTTGNDTNLDYMDTDGEISPQHYAFLVSEAEFDAIFGRVRDRKLTYWADPAQKQEGEINHHDGGRGLYFEDPN